MEANQPTSLEVLIAARRRVLALPDDDPGYDEAVSKLLQAEATSGEAFRGGSWSRTTMPNVQFARRMVTQLSSKKKRDTVPACETDLNADRRERPRDGRDKHHRHCHKKRDRSRDRDHKRRDRRSSGHDRDRDRRRESNQRALDSVAVRAVMGVDSQSGDAAEQRRAVSTAPLAAPPTTLAEAPQAPRWVRKGMRVRLVSGTNGAGVYTAVVSAARDAAAVTLRHDGTGAVLTAQEEALLPARPAMGGSAILLSGEHEGQVGRVAFVSLSERRVTVQLGACSVECHLLDVSEWAQPQGGLGSSGTSFVDTFDRTNSQQSAWVRGSDVDVFGADW